MNRPFRSATRSSKPALRAILLELAALSFLTVSPAPAYEPCDIRLQNLSMESGKPGDELVLYGEFGHVQGEKIPCINKGNMNRLEVLSWFPSRIRARIPEKLKPGDYKVGIYCNDLSKGGSYSSGWLDFKMLPSEEEPTFGQSGGPGFPSDIRHHNGMAYRIKSYNADAITVAIDLPALLPQRFQVDARGRSARLPEGRIGELAGELLELGAVAIDISYTTTRIAAEFPVHRLNWNSWIEGKAVQLLYDIRDQVDR